MPLSHGAQGRRRACRSGRRAHARGKRGGGWREAASTALLIGTLNIQSLKPKLLELSHEVDQSRYDLLVINETWLKPSTPNRLLTIPGYSIRRADRPDGRGYGGVALLVRDQMSAVTLKLSTQSHPDSLLESAWSLLGMYCILIFSH